tara:strand:+ start:2339 stop:3340 length:1002 start_codon:yes stop_codon:yes gene_type:complete
MSTNKTNIVVQGISEIDEIPELIEITNYANIRCAPNLETLRSSLPGTEILLGWNFEADTLEKAWDQATHLKWIQWGGAGVDAVLFPELVESDVILTNMRGIFDRAMAEYVLGLIIAFAKDFPETYKAQTERRWSYRLTNCIEKSNVLIVGTGGIGRMIGYLLKAVGCHVNGVARTARSADDVFNITYAIDDLNKALIKADYVVLAAPLTTRTKNFFGEIQFATMKNSSYLINVGRGALIDENALIDALQNKNISGAALDVFQSEPLSPDNPLWSMNNVIISPHMSGDYYGHRSAMAHMFLENLNCFRHNLPLRNTIDKNLGFIATEPLTDKYI